MTAETFAKETHHWISTYGFSSSATLERRNNSYIIEFIKHTTKTRASSIVTRIEQIVQSVGSKYHVVDKFCLAEEPKTRDALAPWLIYVEIPIQAKGPHVAEPRSVPTGVTGD